jgi:hypothetical protein
MQPGFDRNAKCRGRFGFEVDWYIGVCPGCQKKVEAGAPLRTRLSVEQSAPDTKCSSASSEPSIQTGP